MMLIPSPNKLILILALFLVTAPAGAEENQMIEPIIDLQSVGKNSRLALDGALEMPSMDLTPAGTSAENDDLSTNTRVAVASIAHQRLQWAEHSRTAARDAWRSQQRVDAAQARAAGNKKGIGRWLKKHWYAPVLAGALIIVATADDDSDGPDDIED